MVRTKHGIDPNTITMTKLFKLIHLSSIDAHIRNKMEDFECAVNTFKYKHSTQKQLEDAKNILNMTGVTHKRFKELHIGYGKIREHRMRDQYRDREYRDIGIHLRDLYKSCTSQNIVDDRLYPLTIGIKNLLVPARTIYAMDPYRILTKNLLAQIQLRGRIRDLKKNIFTPKWDATRKKNKKP